VYRFVEHDPPTAADFVPVLLQRPNNWPGRECEAAGLSVLTDLADAARQRRRFKGFRRRKVAGGTIEPEHGDQQAHAACRVPLARDVVGGRRDCGRSTVRGRGRRRAMM
jgi:hypothetical protein